MRVLLLADRSFATREHAMLRRLEIGLIDEGLRVVRANPPVPNPEPTTGLAGALTYNDRAWRYIMPAPERTLARDLMNLSLEARPDSDEEPGIPIDLIHAFGDSAAPLALDLSRALDVDVLIEVWSAALCARMAAIERRRKRSGPTDADAGWMAPDEAMLDAARRSAIEWPVFPSKWGAHALPRERPPRPANAPTSFCVLSSGHDPHGLLSFLNGLSRAAAAHENILVFLDAAGVDRHPFVWREVGALGLHDRLSVIADMESRRELILDADVLIQPESRGEHRTVVMEAMACGVAVVARADPLIEGLHAPQAITVLDPSSDAWAHAIQSILTSPDAISTTAAAGVRFAKTHCTAHQQVLAALNAYRTLCSTGALSLDETTR